MGLGRARQLQLLQHEIASAALSGVGMDEIERTVIAPSECSGDDKTALRLYAFSFLPRFEQRRIAFDRLSTSRPELARSRSGRSRFRVSPEGVDRPRQGGRTTAKRA